MPSYCGAPPVPAELIGRWNLDPVVLGALAILLALAWRTEGSRRSAGIGATAILALAFVSPVCALSVSLFSARALHHLLLVALAAPLLAAAWPPRFAMPPLPALLLSTATLWMWHVPAAYDAALANTGLYWAMQLSLLGSAWLFWAAIDRAAITGACTAIVGGAMQMGMLGALLTFAPRALYDSHLSTTLPYGLGPLADQQLAGLTMWVVGLVPYAAAMGWRLRGDWRRVAAA